MTKKNTVTQQQIEDIIGRSDIEAVTMGDKTTVVQVILPNGFIIIESSSCVDPVNYDFDMGISICMDRVKNKVWELEGYVLQNDIYRMKTIENF